MKKLRKWGSSILCALFLLFAVPFTTQAADGAISFSDPSANVGENVTVSVKVQTNGCNIGATDITLTYDPSILEYVDGGAVATGGSGSVHIAGVAGDDQTNNITYKITFKTLAGGSSQVAVSNYEIYDFDENLVSMSHVGSANVSVADGSSNASADATLSALAVSVGSLSPEFAPQTYEYTMDVGADVSSVAIDAKVNDSKAVISSIKGNENLQAGSNKIKIKVKAENGDTATYVIKVNKPEQSEEEDTPEETTEPENTEEPQNTQEPENTEEPQDTEEPQVDTDVDANAGGDIVVNGKTLVPTDLPAQVDIPGFVVSTLEYNGQQYPAYISKYMEYYVLYMTDAEGNSDYYAYYKDINAFTEFVLLTSNQDGSMFILDGFDSDLTELGFVSKELEINGKKITAWAYNEEMIQAQETYKDYYLVAGVNQDGLLTWYQYDAVEGTYQRYAANTSVTTSSGDAQQVTLLEEQLKELTKNYQTMKSQRLTVIIILGILDLIFIMVIVNLIFKLRDKDDAFEEEEDWEEAAEPEENVPEVKEERVHKEERKINRNKEPEEEKPEAKEKEPEPVTKERPVNRPQKNQILEKKSLVKETQNLFDDDDDEFDFEIIDLDDEDDRK